MALVGDGDRADAVDTRNKRRSRRFFTRWSIAWAGTPAWSSCARVTTPCRRTARASIAASWSRDATAVLSGARDVTTGPWGALVVAAIGLAAFGATPTPSTLHGWGRFDLLVGFTANDVVRPARVIAGETSMQPSRHLFRKVLQGTRSGGVRAGLSVRRRGRCEGRARDPSLRPSLGVTGGHLHAGMSLHGPPAPAAARSSTRSAVAVRPTARGPVGTHSTVPPQPWG